uniref:Immunoglobulin domain-containing protein n=1 Tax=Capra hircus TaxID=9925 RepID=A0A452EHL0_CAPHI
MCPALLSLLSLGESGKTQLERPSLSAWPRPMVNLGQTLTLWCHSVGTSLPELQGHDFNTFTLGPVTREHAQSYMFSGFYRSVPVEPLQIVVTGVFTKPAISAHPGPHVRSGETVTLHYHSLLLPDKFILHKKSSTGHFQRCRETLTGGHAPADFSIGLMTLASVGTYRCYGSLRHSPYEWSAPSNPMDIVITGENPLSAQGDPVLRSGENVTFLCSSEHVFQQFHLLREGQNFRRPHAGRQGPHGALQAEFPLGPGTPAHSGVYRCYGSFTRSPYSWSHSRNPLFLSVAGSTTSTCPSPMYPHTTEETRLPQGHSSTWYIVLGLSIAFTSTSIILAALVCHWCSTQTHVAIMEGEPQEDQAVKTKLMSPPTEDVIYAHLNHGTLSKRRITPTPMSPMHAFTKPRIYEDFNVNQDCAEP